MPFFVGRFRTFMWDYWEASFRGWKDVLISGDEFRWKNYRIRCMTLGSLLQLQRMGNPYGRLGEIDLGSGGGMWEALGVEDMGARVYFFGGVFMGAYGGCRGGERWCVGVCGG